MSLVYPTHPLHFNSYKRQRRTATAVLAGDFDLRPTKDILTSLLNGVGPYKAVEKDEGVRRSRKRQRRERDKETAGPVKALDKKPTADLTASVSAPVIQPSSFWRAFGTSQRPNTATIQRSVSITPPPMASSPRFTPGPSDWLSTSQSSSTRLVMHRKKRVLAVRRGWKGWVEGSPPPDSGKLINVVLILPEGRTRSGKSFAVGVGACDCQRLDSNTPLAI